MHFLISVFLAASATFATSQGLLPYVPFEYAAADPSMTEDCIWAAHFPDPNRPPQGSTCASLAEFYSISEANFTAWNPIVGAGCSNLTGNSTLASTYCVQTKGCHCGPPLAQSIDSSTTTECTFYERWPMYHNSSGQPNCSTLPNFSRASEMDFVAWNPSIGSDCSNISWFQEYCFEVNWSLYDSPDWWFTPGLSNPFDNYRGSRVVPPPYEAQGPVDADTVDDCTWYMTWPEVIDHEGQSFYVPSEAGAYRDVAEAYGISEEEFFEWNPVLGGEYGNLQDGNSYCVNVTAFPSSATEIAAESEEEEAEAEAEAEVESGAEGYGGSVVLRMLAAGMLLFAGCNL